MRLIQLAECDFNQAAPHPLTLSSAIEHVENAGTQRHHTTAQDPSSRSTYALCTLGCLKGRGLQAGDALGIGAAKRLVKEGKAVPEALRRGPGTAPELRVLTGLYWHRRTAESGKRFFEDT
jgi:hypothetical protein